MKKIFFLFVLHSCYFSIGQTQAVKFSKFYSKSAFSNLSSFNSSTISLSLKKIKPCSYSFYNKNTGLNDFYILTGNTFTTSKSSMPLCNNLNGMKTDSFNPNGTSNIYAALAMGFFNLITK